MAKRYGNSSRSSRRGQAALEFLSTYGWAIMVVLVMIGALAYFGVLNPNKYLPEKCVFGTGLACSDFVALQTATAADFNISFALENGMGETVSITRATLVYEGRTVSCDNGTSGVNSWTLASGDRIVYRCANLVGLNPGRGQRVKAAVNTTYTQTVGGSFPHPLSGDIQAVVQ